VKPVKQRLLAMVEVFTAASKVLDPGAWHGMAGDPHRKPC
jgi:hypothetical protein